MKILTLAAGVLLLTGSGALAQTYDLTIHLADGRTVTFAVDELRSLGFGGVTSGVLDPGGEDEKPRAFQVLGNYPNPFNPVTTIAYDTPAAALVVVRVFDLHGALVRELLHEPQSAGRHEVVWDGTGRDRLRVSSGVYFCPVVCGEQVRTRSMVLVK